jgi:hypothetical protein
MFTTVAWFETLAAFLTWTKLAAVPDQHIKTQGDSIFVSGYNRLIGAYTNLDPLALGARFVSPSIRRMAPIEISPLRLGLLPSATPTPMLPLSLSIPLDIDEQLEAEAYGSGAITTASAIIAWLADADISPVRGPIFSVRATIELALVAGTWSFSNLEFAEDLPVGSYDCVGFDVVAGEGCIARLVPVGGNNRPGVIVRQLVTGIIPQYQFRYGNMGVFCSFPHNNVPGVEVFALTDEANEVYQCVVDLIKK